MNDAKQYEDASPNANHQVEPEAIPARLPNVIYLAGIPRTGSTVLGQRLGGMPGVIFVGELSLFWRRFANGELCSCGEPLASCRFWSAIVSKGFGELKPEVAQNLGNLEWTLRRQQAIRSILPIGRKIDKYDHFHTIADARMRLYRSIAEIAQASWIVDSGKDPWLGNLFSCLFRNNFGTVHIVRDPRGVAFSWTKSVRSDSEPGYMQRRHPMRTAFNWVIQNLVIQFLLQRPGVSYVRVRYEDLAADPETVIHGVARAMKIRVGQAVRGNIGEAHENSFHWVAGNPGVRQAANSHLEIRLDEEWRHRLPLVQCRLVTAICGALFPFYGYTARS